MKRFCASQLLLLSFFLFSEQVAAQFPDMQVHHWLDGFNIRYQLGQPVWEDAQAEDHLREVSWNSPKQCFTSELPALLRYEALEEKGYTTVRVKHYYISHDRAYYPYFSKPTAATIIHTLEQFTVSRLLTDEQLLQYNAQGYLIRRSRKRITADPALTGSDTDQYTYERRTDGQQIITRVSTRVYRDSRLFQDTKNGAFYSDNCCGTLYKGPVEQTDRNDVTFQLNAREQLTGITQYSAGYVNGCRKIHCKPGEDTGTLVRTISYDVQGRISAYRDSSVMQQEALSTVWFQYSDRPYRSTDVNPPALNVPLMRQYLSLLKKPVVTTIGYVWYGYNYKPEGRDSTKYSDQQATVVYDDRHQLRFRFGPDYEGKERHTAYREGTDSLGSYKNATGLYDLLKNTDDAIYRPTPYRERVTVRTGCVVRDHFAQPAGTVASGTPQVSERIVIGSIKDSLYVVSYGLTSLVTGYEDDPFWAPGSFERYGRNIYSPEDLIIVDRRGLVLYYYSKGNVYLLDYE